jgi:3',5'-cyclic AMP phosphodiesterase CpdA
MALIAAVTLAAFSQEPEPNALYLGGGIEIDVRPDGDAVISWTSLEPAPAGTAYLGQVPSSADLPMPRYRRYARESYDGMATAHSVSFEIPAFETASYDISGLVKGGGGTLHVRLEVWNPRAQQALHFHTRFGYAKSEDGAYRRVPCITLGPFVDMVTENSAVISWETDLPAHCNLGHRVGDGPIAYEMRTGTLPEGEGPHMWEWELTDLPAETEVEYRVRLEDPESGAPLFEPLDRDEPERWELLRTFAFRTAPPRGASTSFQFAAMSDSRADYATSLARVEGVNYAALQELLPMALRAGADFIVFPGDEINGYTASTADFERQLRSWRMATESVGALIPICEGMGNHEVVGPQAPERSNIIWRSYTDDRAPEAIFSRHFVNPKNGPGPETEDAPPYGETVYSFDWGNAHFASVNSNYWWKRFGEAYPDDPGNREGFVMDGQLAWLDADLAAARERGQDHLFVYTHEPMFPNGGHTGDAMYWGGRIPEVLEMRDKFVEVCSRNGVLAVMHGDEHNYSRMLVTSDVTDTVTQPLWQIVTGGSGAPFYNQSTVPWSEHVRAFDIANHFVMFEVDGADVTIRAISRDGAVLDEASLTGERAAATE